jgi:folate-binding protein YgfZ
MTTDFESRDPQTNEPIPRSPLSGDSHIPLNYGNLHEEYQALRRQAGLLDFSSWTKLSVTGADRKSFLHGMLTNDVKGLAAGSGNYTLLLSAKGKIQADLWLFDRGDDVFAYARENLRETLNTLFNKYVIIDDVQIQDISDDWRLVSLQGPHSAEILAKVAGENAIPQLDYHFTDWNLNGLRTQIFRVSHTGETGFDLLTPKENHAALWGALVEAGAVPAGSEALTSMRIEAGIPYCGVDIDDQVIPQEASLHHALHFTKGCYLGQEVVARLHFRGHVNRELAGFIIPTDTQPQGDLRIFSHGNEIGKITSVCYSLLREQWIGLGFIRCEHRKAGLLVEGSNGCIDFQAEVVIPPFTGAQ